MICFIKDWFILIRVYLKVFLRREFFGVFNDIIGLKRNYLDYLRILYCKYVNVLYCVVRVGIKELGFFDKWIILVLSNIRRE